MKRALYSGVFDLVHLGHLMALRKIKKKAGYLIVYVASDRETKAVKGDLRPIIPAKERVELIKEFKCVDEVFTSEYYMTDEEVIKKANADLMVRNEGSEDRFSVPNLYIKRCVPKSGLDTTSIIKKIKSKEDQKPLAGVNFAVIYKNEILLQKRDNKKGIRCPNKLVILGGKLEKGEDPLLCAVRELKEETGIDLHPKHFEFLTDFVYPWGENNRFYIVRLKNKPKIESNEGKINWYKLSKNLKLGGNQNVVLKMCK